MVDWAGTGAGILEGGAGFINNFITGTMDFLGIEGILLIVGIFTLGGIFFSAVMARKKNTVSFHRDV